ncbi:MAG: diguanylate cyclase, partial [Actinomycetota bacterium]
MRWVVACLVTGLVVTIGWARITHADREARRDAEFALDSQRILADLADGLERQIDAIKGTARFVELVSPISPDDFSRLFDADADNGLSAVASIAIAEHIPADEFDAFMAREARVGGVTELDLFAEPDTDPTHRTVITRALGFDNAIDLGGVGEGVGLDITAFMGIPVVRTAIENDLSLLPLDLFQLEAAVDPELEDFAFALVVPLSNEAGERIGWLTANGGLPLIAETAVGPDSMTGVAVIGRQGGVPYEIAAVNTETAGSLDTAARSATDVVTVSGIDFTFEVWSGEAIGSWWEESLGVLVVGSLASLIVSIGAALAWRARQNERRARQELTLSERRAKTDPLTGLLNRTGLDEALLTELDRLHRSGGGSDVLAVMFCDIDRFKRINDMLGHESGDELLVELAGRLDDVVSADHHAGRFGGDEFIVIAPFDDADSARAFATTVAGALTLPTVLDGILVDVRTSVGLTLATPDDDRLGADLLRDADTAMYRAKATRTAAMMEFDDTMRAAVVEQVRIEGELRTALERDELSVHYQGLFDQRGALTGLEALTRWQHPERGLLTTGVFIRAAQEAGRWREISWRALDQSVADMAAATDLDIDLAVNLAPEQLLEDDVAAIVRETLDRHGLDPRRLVLEISEDVVMDDD